MERMAEPASALRQTWLSLKRKGVAWDRWAREKGEQVSGGALQFLWSFTSPSSSAAVPYPDDLVGVGEGHLPPSQGWRQDRGLLVGGLGEKFAIGYVQRRTAPSAAP